MTTERIEWETRSAPARKQIQLRSKGGPRKVLPFEQEILDAEPPFDELVDDVLHALFDLETSRQLRFRTEALATPFGAIPILFPMRGPISYNDIRAYWTARGLDDAAVFIMTSATLAGDRKLLELERDES